MTSRAQKIIIGITVADFIVVAAFGVLVGAALYGWKAALRAGNEAATLQNLKTIAAVEIQYFNTHKRAFGTFEELIKEQMLTSKFAGNPPIVDGYVMTLKVTPRTTTSTTSYTLNADPQDNGSGTNHFYIDSTDSSIHLNQTQAAGPNDPVQ